MITCSHAAKSLVNIDYMYHVVHIAKGPVTNDYM